MKWLLAGMLLLMGGCVQLPTIAPMEADRRPGIEMDCRSHFPQGHWQLVHTIRARFYGGRQATFTGVVVLSTHAESIHCVLMTVEGMVLFEAADNRHSITVKRAFGPFESPDFAQGVMADIRFLFSMPEGGLITVGVIDDGTPTCRYQGQDQTIVDLMETNSGGWAIHQYDAHGKLLRRAVAEAVNSEGIASRMGIDAGRGRHSYHLSLDLVESVKLP